MGRLAAFPRPEGAPKRKAHEAMDLQIILLGMTAAVPLGIVASVWGHRKVMRKRMDAARHCAKCKHLIALGQATCPECGAERPRAAVQQELAADYPAHAERMRVAHQRIAALVTRVCWIETALLLTIVGLLLVPVYFFARSMAGMAVPEWAVATKYYGSLDEEIPSDVAGEVLSVNLIAIGFGTGAGTGAGTAAGLPAVLEPTEVAAGIVQRMSADGAPAQPGAPAGAPGARPLSALQGIVQTTPEARLRSGVFTGSPWGGIFQLPHGPWSAQRSWQLGYSGGMERGPGDAEEWLSAQLRASPGASGTPTTLTPDEAQRIARAVIALRDTPGGIPWQRFSARRGPTAMSSESRFEVNLIAVMFWCIVLDGLVWLWLSWVIVRVPASEHLPVSGVFVAGLRKLRGSGAPPSG